MTGRNWLSTAERGSILGIRFMVALCGFVGRPAARFVLKFVALYYLLFATQARRASRSFLRRFHARVTLSMIYRHILNFAEVALDRVFLLRGQFELFEVSSNGFEHMRKLREEKRGAILLGAHLGSFEAMRLCAGKREVPINIITYRGNARMLNSVLAAVSPGAQSRFIELTPGDVNSILRVKELIEAGEMVAILGDRAELDAKAVAVDFFGAKARFPSGLFVLAATLRCPVYLTFSIYRSPNRYEFFCESFAEQIELPRGDREAALLDTVQRYAKRLEHYCRMEPGNWFNFYDFWNES